MSVWKIGTTAQSYAEAMTFADAGLANLRRVRIANGMDEVTFDAPWATALTDDLTPGESLTFAYGSSYIVWRDGARWFYGRCVSAPRMGSAQAESWTVRLAGPWWYFDNVTYMQSWKVWDTVGEEVVNANKSRVVLFEDADGNRITSGAQVGDVVDWLITRGAPIAKGTIDAGITLPFDERANMSCAEALDVILRWTPDYIGWFDYTTSPSPTFHWRARANLSAESLAITGAEMSGLSITPRYDLQKPGVEITYEKTNSVDGTVYETVEIDEAGDVDALDTVFASFDLAGMSQTRLTQAIVTEDFPAENDKTWWMAHASVLAGLAVGDITIHDHDVDAQIESYERYLTEGQIQDWMDKDAVLGRITAQADIIVRDGANGIVTVLDNVPVAFDVMATDAEAKTYSILDTYDSGEETPVGVAAALYAAWNTLHFQGSFHLTQEECAGAYAPGKTLNLTGGRTAWATMAALIQECVEDVDAGITSVTFGPPARIEADTLVALFRALRGRRFSYKRIERTNGQTASGNVALSGPNPVRNQGHAEGEHKRLVVAEENDDGSHKCDVNPAAVAHADEGDDDDRTLEPREVLVVEVDAGGNHIVKRRQVLCSESYHQAFPVSGVDHAFRFRQTSATGGALSSGRFYAGGALVSIVSLPSTLSGVTSSIKYWITYEVATNTPTWTSGAAFPEGDEDTEIYPILEITCADSVITGIKQCQTSDIHVERIAGDD